MRRRRAPLWVIVLLLPLWWCASADDAAGEPATVVTRLTDAVMSMARLPEEQDFDARMALIRPVVADTHAIETIARLVLGRYWRELTEQQQASFMECFLELSAATFAGRFDRDAGQSFVIVESTARPRGHHGVVAEFRRPSEPAIEFEFLLQETPDGWRITNILVDGVSDLALKRSEYAAIMRDQGFEALMEELQAQIQAQRQP